MPAFVALFLSFFLLAHAQIASAQAAAAANAYNLFMAKVTTFGASTVAFSSNGAVLANGVRTFSAPTFSAGGAAVATAGRLAVGTGSAAVVVTGGVTGAEVFAAARLLAMGGTGFLGIGLTALTMAPMVVNYFTSDKSRLGSLSARDGPTPFEVLKVEEGCSSTGQCVWYRNSGDEVRFVSASAACNAVALRRGPSATGTVGEGLTCVVKLDGMTLGTFYLYTEPRQGSSSAEWVPASWSDIAQYMDKPTTPDQMGALLDAGAKIQVAPKTITGPSEVVEPVTKTTTETPEKIIETTTTPKTKLDYLTKVDPTTGQLVPYVQATPSSTTVVEETDKATGIKKVVSSTTTEAPKPAETEKVIVCGLPDTPPCAIDEKDTPAPVEADVYKPQLDDYKTKQAELKDKVSGMDDKSFFSGWSGIFITPPLAACTGYILPRDMGTIDPCPVVDGVRTIMAYIWALTALFLAVGMVKKVV